ncbi:DUF11 domain-containing protein [Streptomyces sp. 12297]
MRSVFKGSATPALRRALASCAGTACLLLPLAPSATAQPPAPTTPTAEATTSATHATTAHASNTSNTGDTTESTGPTDTTATPAEGSPRATHTPSRAHPPTPAAPSAPSAPAAPHADLTVSAALRQTPPQPRKEDEERAEDAAEDGGRQRGDEDGRLHAAATATATATFDYAVTVTNHGPSDARRVVVTDLLPAALEFASSRDGCTAAGRTVTCGPLAALPVGRSHTWVITVRLASGYGGDGSDIVNEAVVGAETSDPDPENNKASVTGLEIPPDAREADLSLAKTALLAHGRTTVAPGERFTYRITVHNHGPAAARDVRVTDPLPSALAFVSSPDGCAPAKAGNGSTDGARPDGARTVRCPARDRLAAGERAEYRITVRVTARERTGTPKRCTRIDNIARVTSSSPDPDPSDNANRPGTTAPGGKPLCLASGRDGGGEDGHHGHDGGHDNGHDNSGHDNDGHDEGRGDDGHHGRGDLADSGSALPGWLLWTAGGLVTAGAALRTVSGTARRTGVKE